MRPQRVIVTTLITPFALALTLGGCTKKEEEKKPEAADPAKAGAADPGAEPGRLSVAGAADHRQAHGQAAERSSGLGEGSDADPRGDERR